MLQLKCDFKKGETVIVGVSGGADSVALLHLLKNESNINCFNLVCVHVNHHIRGLDSNKDEKFVEKLCKEFNVKFKKYDIDCLKEQKITGESLEQVARRLRYNCFWQAIAEFHADHLVLAHHKNDQAETILMNIIRGSGPLGAIGIKQNKKILRPLLDFTKEEIINYCSLNKLDFVKDKTNDDSQYTRNYIRNIIFPQIEKINPQAQDNVVNFGKILELDEDYFTAILPYNLVNLDEKNNKIYISTEIFKLHPSISIRLIKYALSNFGWAIDLTRTHYNMILNLSDLKNGSKISLPHEITVIKEYGQIVFIKGDLKATEIDIKFNIGEFKVGKILIEVKKESPRDVDFNSDLKYADYLKIPQNAVFRRRKAGDKFSKINGGTTSLSDYLIDKKVPQRQRSELIVLAYQSEVLWISGLDVSDKIKIDSETETIVSFKVKQ